MARKQGTHSPDNREAELKQRQRLKMARSAHAYVRGSTREFYRWLAEQPRDIPEGPAVWICGDCHAGNLGPVADADGNVEIQIRDLDQTVIGNPAHDLLRLALSLASAVRGSNLSGVVTAHMMEEMTGGYLAGLRAPFRPAPLGSPANPVREILRTAVRRRWKHLAAERIEGVKPTIPLGRSFWQLSKQERKAIAALVKEKEVHKMITGLEGRDNSAKIRLADAAYWCKGCSSLGLLRMAALVEVEDAAPCLLDIKQAVAPLAPVAKSAHMPATDAERVVEGARALSPNLGERMLAAMMLRRPVFIRELMPQDLKLEMETLTRDQAVCVARFLAQVVGKAHGRQMNAATRQSWARGLQRQKSRKLDAPGWLWANTVALLAAHEAAYLEHCRSCRL